MDSTGEEKTPLEERMEERMRELGISWTDVLRRAGGMSRQNLLDIRKGTKSPRPKTRTKIEQALELATGGFEQMERGEKPSPAPAPAEEPTQHTSAAAEADLADLLAMPRESVIRIATMIEQASGQAAAERFLRDAFDLRQRHSENGGIEPFDRPERDVN